MPHKIIALSWFLLLFCLWVPSFAVAGSLVFNDSAAGPIEIHTLDWSPGNSLSDEALPLQTDPNNPTRFNQAYQAALNNFLNGKGNVIAGTGLNVSYEITIVSTYGQIGVRSPLDIDSDGFVEIENSNFDLDAAGNVNFVEIYLDTNHNANSLAGTGYRDGILLMKGVVSAATGQFSATLDADGNNILDVKALDQFLTNNYVGTGTISGSGAAQLTVEIDPASVNRTYFPKVGSAPLTFFFNTSLIVPYSQQNPSASVVGVVPELGSAFGVYSRVNGLASLDPTQKVDMLFQADANSSISVGPCIDIVKEVSVDGGQTWSDANNLDESPGTTDGAIYRFIVTNCSSVMLTDVTVTDPNLGENGLPLILDLGSLAPETSVTVEPNSNFGSPLLEKPLLCADVPPPGNEDPIKFNLASVVGTVSGTSTTVEDSDPAYVRCLCVDIEKLVSIDGGATFVDADQCVDPAAPIATGAVEYQLVLSNCGAAVLNDVRVVDSLLGIDEAVGSLLPGQEVAYDKEDLSALLQPDFCALFDGDTAGSRDIDNTATVTATAFNQQFDLSDADSACVSCLCTGEIGDFVWNDLDRDGIQDVGEPGIGGVTVTLLMDGQALATTTTDANGAYLFSGLCAGDYSVTVATPDGYMPSPIQQGGDAALDSNGSPADVTLSTDNSSDRTIDFGFYPPCTGSIGDFVWNDLNRNGIQDAGEPGISAVTVNLLQGGAVISTTMTDGNGFYQFSDLCAGTYAVTVTTPDGFTPSQSLQGSDMVVDSNGSPATVTLTTDNSSDPTIDFGFYLMDAKIGDYVWLDENRNGIQDAGEEGLSGVAVNLLDCDGNVIETTSTDGTGYYSFTVEPGDYKVQFVLPAGYAFSPKDQGADDAKDSDAADGGMTVCTTLEPGENDPTWDAGMYPMPATIGDYVWNDTNKNGVQDAGEMGITNVTVKLYNCTTNELVTTTTTDANGAYSFTGLMPGSYRVEFTAPMGYDFTMADQGGDDAKDSDANATGVTDCYDIAAGQTNNTIDAGLTLLPATIGDYVWNDTNKNGVQDAGEMGITGVTVKLYNCTTNELVTTTTTDANGAYSFTGLMPGSYRVEFTAPMGYDFTMADQGGDDAKDSDANATGVTDCYDIAAGQTNNTIDAGLTLMPATIGDYVWNDTNKNGVQDAGEMGITGVTVKLYNCTTNELVTTTTTDANGAYSFTGLMPGSYRVEFTAPMGYDFTMADQGGDDAKDSDANATGVTDCYDIAAGQTNNTIDAGLWMAMPSIDIEKFVKVCETDSEVSSCEYNHDGHEFGDHDVEECDYNRDGKCDTGDRDYCDKNSYSCSNYDKDHCDYDDDEDCDDRDKYTCDKNRDGSCNYRDKESCFNHTGDGSSVETGCEYNHDGHEFGDHDVEECDYNRDGKCDTGDRDYCGKNSDSCRTYDRDHCDYDDDGDCDDRDKYTCDKNRDGYCNYRDKESCFNHNDGGSGEESSYQCTDWLDADELTGPIVPVCSGTSSTDPNDSGCEYSHDGHEFGDHDVEECDYNRDGKCDTGDRDYCGKNSDSCRTYDRDHCDYDDDGDCDDRDRYTCDKNRDGYCNYRDKESCFNHPEEGDSTPPASSCGKVSFKFVITNSGPVTLTNLTLNDNVFDVSGCVLPDSLAPGATYTCEIGPFPAEAGQHTNTATAGGFYMGTTVTDADNANYFGGTPTSGCVRSPGYWKNHPEAWPVSTISIGGHDYTMTQAIAIMDKPVAGDKTYTLFPALVAAKLDVLSGANDDCIADTIVAAEAWMFKYPVGSGVKGDSEAWKLGEPLYLKLDQYINGKLCASYCGEPVPPTPTPSNPTIDIEKFTNGFDADVAPGPYVSAGATVKWEYVVKNKGDVALSGIKVTDDKVSSISCPKTSLQAGESMTCSATGSAIFGQYVNTGSVVGYAGSVKVSDADKSHYYGSKTMTGCGTGTPGYWKNHPAAWPVSSIVIGGVSYSKEQAIAIIAKSVAGDKTYTMFPALVSAKLNVMTGTNSSCVSDTISAADAWLKTYKVGSGVTGSGSAWSAGEPLYQKLDSYNNGLLCAPHRDSTKDLCASSWVPESKVLVCEDDEHDDDEHDDDEHDDDEHDDD